MPAPQNFRSAFNGFNREDVVHYLEYLNSKHTAQVNQLISEGDFLRSKLENLQAEPVQEDLVSALEQERDDLRAQLEALQQHCAELEQKLAEAEARPAPAEAPAPNPSCTMEQELEAYRRAERTERLARERAELIYHQANSVLADATARVDGIAEEIGTMADLAMNQLSQLQVAVSTSKQALKDAASIMYTIRPDNK